MDPFREQVRKGFQACRNDIQIISSNQENISEKLNSLEEENLSLKSEIRELKEILSSLNSKLSKTVFKQEEPVRISIPTQKKDEKDSYDALLEFKAKVNRREVIKQKMISTVGENGVQLAELKFMIVNHFKYCSKATFYNYLKELELERFIRVERENSRNLVFLTNLPSQRLDNR